MAIARTNTNLAEFCKQVVGAPYFYGCFGQKATAQLYASKKKQYPSYYPPKSWTEDSFKKHFGKRVTDCAGLIKWFLWSNNMTDKSPTYKASEDIGANTFYSKCTSKGKIGTLPADKVGILVFKGTDAAKNHVGVIVDNDGTVVEAKGHAYGTVKSKASQWGYWGKCHLIKYEKAAQEPVVEPTTEPENKPTPEPAPVAMKFKVTTASKIGLRIRKSPSTGSVQVGYIPEGKVVTVTEVVEGKPIDGNNKWGKVKYNGVIGYSSMAYLK